MSTSTIANLFKRTTYNKGHKHAWIEGLKFTTINQEHNHIIDTKKMLALPAGKNYHSHRLTKKNL